MRPARTDSSSAQVIPLCRSTEPDLAERASPVGRRPIVVVEDEDGYLAALAELAGAGWSEAHTGSPGDVTCATRTVRDASDAGATVATVARGVGVLVRIACDADVAADLLDDLASIGPVVHIAVGSALALDRDTWRLAHEIARGNTVEAAARALHMSSRTANRRLTGARQVLGVDSRAQLVRALASPERIPSALSPR